MRAWRWDRVVPASSATCRLIAARTLTDYSSFKLFAADAVIHACMFWLPETIPAKVEAPDFQFPLDRGASGLGLLPHHCRLLCAERHQENRSNLFCLTENFLPVQRANTKVEPRSCCATVISFFFNRQSTQASRLVRRRIEDDVPVADFTGPPHW